MANKSYQKGYNFQQRIKKFLEENGFYVQISPKSRFPDGIALIKTEAGIDAFFFECKFNKYLSKSEKQKAEELKKKHGLDFIVYWNDNRRIASYCL